MIEGIRHIGIVVDNLDTSLSFYTKNFGFIVEKDEYEKGVFIEEILGINGAAKAGDDFLVFESEKEAKEIRIRPFINFRACRNPMISSKEIITSRSIL